MAAFTPFASAYAPVDALSTRQMAINAAEQARQLEMQRMAQAERQAQLGAALQARQLQDNQAAREMQAALSFRQQAEVEAHNRAVLGDAAATRNAQLGWNQKDLEARERMTTKGLESNEKVAGMRGVDPKMYEFQLLEKIEKDAVKAKSRGAAARANAALEKAVFEDLVSEKSGLFTSKASATNAALLHLSEPKNKDDITKRKRKLKPDVQSRLLADELGVLKWNESTFQWEPAFETGAASEPSTLSGERPAGLSPDSPFKDFGVSFDGPVIPPAANAPVIVAPRISAPPVRSQAAPFIFNASPYGIGGMTAPGPSIPQSQPVPVRPVEPVQGTGNFFFRNGVLYDRRTGLPVNFSRQ